MIDYSQANKIKDKYTKESEKKSSLFFIISILTFLIFAFAKQFTLAFLFLFIFLIIGLILKFNKPKNNNEFKEEAYIEEAVSFMLNKNNVDNIKFLTNASNKEYLLKESSVIDNGLYKIKNYTALTDYQAESIDIFGTNNNSKIVFKLIKIKLPKYVDGDIFIYSNNGQHEKYTKFITQSNEFNKKFNVFQSKAGLSKDILDNNTILALTNIKQKYVNPITIRISGNYMYIKIRNNVLTDVGLNTNVSNILFEKAFQSINTINHITDSLGYKLITPSKEKNEEVISLEIKDPTVFVDGSTKTEDIINILI